jgi:hypothetical protein
MERILERHIWRLMVAVDKPSTQPVVPEEDVMIFDAGVL